MKKYKILSREVLISNQYCPVEKQLVELPNGKTIDWYVNTSADSVIIVPFLKSGDVQLQRIYIHGCGLVITVFCAVLID